MRFSSNYASVPTVTSKGAETKRDSPCIMIFALNSIALFDAFRKFKEERNLLCRKARNIYMTTMNKEVFSRNININGPTIDTAVFFK